MRTLLALLLMSTAALADEYPPGLFERSPEINPSDTSEPLGRPSAPLTPPLEQTPLASAPTAPAPSLALPNDDPYDPQSCFNLRRGLFPTPQAAANARSKCERY
jgi:hypothetical protein